MTGVGFSRHLAIALICDMSMTRNEPDGARDAKKVLCLDRDRDGGPRDVLLAIAFSCLCFNYSRIHVVILCILLTLFIVPLGRAVQFLAGISLYVQRISNDV